MKLIKAIYTQQKAKVRINGELSKEIQIQKGTRQGCPLSPLLFILTLEILNEQIRGKKELKGLKVKGQIYNLQAFADDLVIILEDPVQSIEDLMSMLKTFGDMAGMRINQKKTKMLTKNIREQERQKLLEKTNFQEEKRIRYLGIQITKRTCTLFKDNDMKLMKEI